MSLDLTFVDELIAVRHGQHGGGVGAPPVAGGYRVGVSLNRSCVVMLSALLQGHVEEVFVRCSTALLNTLATPAAAEEYRESFKRWGNPSASNIDQLFLRLGLVKALNGLRWQKCSNQSLRNKLNGINELRNKIAHGDAHLTLNGAPFSLRLEQIERYRNFVGKFGDEFEPHVRGKLGI